nr:hypothetical protein [Tanacetum cinerariifolium]
MRNKNYGRRCGKCAAAGCWLPPCHIQKCQEISMQLLLFDVHIDVQTVTGENMYMTQVTAVHENSNLD